MLVASLRNTGPEKVHYCGLSSPAKEISVLAHKSCMADSKLEHLGLPACVMSSPQSPVAA